MVVVRSRSSPGSARVTPQLVTPSSLLVCPGWRSESGSPEPRRSRNAPRTRCSRRSRWRQCDECIRKLPDGTAATPRPRSMPSARHRWRARRSWPRRRQPCSGKPRIVTEGKAGKAGNASTASAGSRVVKSPRRRMSHGPLTASAKTRAGATKVDPTSRRPAAVSQRSSFTNPFTTTPASTTKPVTANRHGKPSRSRSARFLPVLPTCNSIAQSGTVQRDIDPIGTRESEDRYKRHPDCGLSCTPLRFHHQSRIGAASGPARLEGGFGPAPRLRPARLLRASCVQGACRERHAFFERSGVT